MGFAVLSAASSFTRKSYRAAFHAAKQINGVRPDSDGDTRLIACARPLASPALTSVSVRALPKSRACDVSRLLYSESNPEPDGLKVQVADVDVRSGGANGAQGAGRCERNRNILGNFSERGVAVLEPEIDAWHERQLCADASGHSGARLAAAHAPADTRAGSLSHELADI